MPSRRIFFVALLLLCALSVSIAASDKSRKKGKSSQECQPFAYDHGVDGQGTWCEGCRTVRLQAPINISSETPTSSQPVIEFKNYDAATELNVYPNNPYNLKIDYKEGTSSIKIGNDTYKLVEFHFHRPGEEAIDNHRYPMVVHLVHHKEQAGCSPGLPGCVAAVAIQIEEGQPTAETSALLTTLFQHFPPPTGKQQGVSISVKGLLPPGSEDAGYYRYDGSLTTPPCTENITFYVLKPRLKFSAEQIAEFARRYPSPNARDIQPVNDRHIDNRPGPPSAGH